MHSKTHTHVRIHTQEQSFGNESEKGLRVKRYVVNNVVFFPPPSPSPYIPPHPPIQC